MIQPNWRSPPHGLFWRPLVVTSLGRKVVLVKILKEELSHSSEGGNRKDFFFHQGYHLGDLNNGRKLSLELCLAGTLCIGISEVQDTAR